MLSQLSCCSRCAWHRRLRKPRGADDRLRHRSCAHRWQHDRQQRLDPQGCSRRRRDGACQHRLGLRWRQPSLRRDFVASDPGAPDTTGRRPTPPSASSRRHGIKVVITISQAPSWAEGSAGRPRRPAGTWEPSSSSLRRLRCSRRPTLRRQVPGPGASRGVSAACSLLAGLERAKPQHVPESSVAAAGRRWIAESPVLYRGLLNAFYAAVKGVAGVKLRRKRRNRAVRRPAWRPADTARCV